MNIAELNQIKLERKNSNIRRVGALTTAFLCMTTMEFANQPNTQFIKTKYKYEQVQTLGTGYIKTENTENKIVEEFYKVFDKIAESCVELDKDAKALLLNNLWDLYE